MTATFPLVNGVPTSGQGVTIALTQDLGPDNPVIGDLDLQNGQIHLWDKRAARRQKVRMVLQFGLGEHWLNPDEGIPWFGQIIGTRRHGVVLGILRQAFLRTLPDLAEIRTLTLDFDGKTRAATVGFDLRFDDGMILNSDDFSPLELDF
jgi:hypothetical protein